MGKLQFSGVAISGLPSVCTYLSSKFYYLFMSSFQAITNISLINLKISFGQLKNIMDT